MADRKDPLVAYHFALQFDGINEATFREASGFDSEVEVVESREAGPKGNTIIKKLPGALKWSNITLKRGFTNDTKLYEWHKEAMQGKMSKARRSGSIVVYDPEDKEVMRYNFVNGWISKWKGADLNATNNQVAVEELTLVHEGLEWKK